ncbi:MAG TPA: ATP-binding cassette domain-containing protein [bacterium]|nr:ATP-binding cassette domain-containing protein [bacterium]
MRVELREIRKFFGAVRANDGVTLAAEAGTIHGVLGENGAGKSTLMKILSGTLVPDGGQILLDGAPVPIGSAARALRAHIGMVHQDPLDFPSLSVLDNFLLGAPAGFVPRRGRARDALRTLAARFGFALDPDARCDHLTVAERQQLEIVRLLWLGVQVLILDEPTTAISASQRTHLFAALRAMAAQGRVVFFVSHKLEEVQELCDRVTVLRRGRVAGEAPIPCDTGRLVRLMFGRELPRAPRPGIPLRPPADQPPAAMKSTPVLELADLAVGDTLLSLEHLFLHAAAGEVVGLAGLEGSGQRLLLQTCAGLTPPIGGRIRIGGRDLTGRPYQRFLAAGVAYVPAGRLGEGLIPGLTLADHAAIGEPRRSAFVDRRQAVRSAARRIQEFNIRGTPDTDVRALSGGNQQRALLALLPARLTLLLMEHPTRGLDLESAEEIWRRLLERRAHGTAIVFSSSDLDELLDRGDRIVVFSGGRVSVPIDARRATVEQLGELIGGKGL